MNFLSFAKAILINSRPDGSNEDEEVKPKIGENRFAPRNTGWSSYDSSARRASTF